MKGKVLIIMPVYNAGIFVESAVESILKQSYQDFKLVIVDDKSTDNTPKIIKKYYNNPKVKVYFNEQNIGPYDIRNFVLKKYAGQFDYFITHDADDLSTVDRIKNLVNTLYDTPFVAVSHAITNIRTSDKVAIKNHRAADASYMYKTEVFNRIGYYSSYYIGSDSYYNKRVKAVFGTSKIAELRDVLLYANIGSHNLMKTINERERYHCIIKLNTLFSKMKKSNNYKLDYDKFPKVDLYNKVNWNKEEDRDVPEFKLYKPEPKIISDKNKVLIIMSAYNAEQFIDKSIKSVINQSYDNFLLVIVDDKSSDKTLDIVREYEKLDKRIKVYSLPENRGSYYARNVGLYHHMKDCGYWTLHDADDIMHRDKINLQVSYIGNLNGITCKYKKIDYKTKQVIKDNLFLHNGWLFKKEVFDKLGYYDDSTRFGGDSEYLERFYKVFNERKHVINRVLMDAYIHGNNQTTVVPLGSHHRYSYVKEYRKNIKSGYTFRDFKIEKVSINYKNENIGVMLIAFGFDYEKISPACAKSIRKFSNIPIQVHTNIPDFVRSSEWNDITNIEFVFHDMLDSENRIIKTQLDKYSKFDKTLYIDVDSAVVSGEFLQPFEYLNDYDIVSPEWREFTMDEITSHSKKTKKYQKFLQVSKKFNFDKEMFISGGICYFKKNIRSRRFFEVFHEFWKETDRLQDMPGLNGALFMNKDIVKIIPKSKYNNTHSTVIKSYHLSNNMSNVNLKGFTRKRYNPKTDKWEYCDQGSRELYTKPKICFIYDYIGWAFYNKAMSIKKHLYKYYEIDLRKYNESFNQNDYDLIITFSPRVMFNNIKHVNNVICGISSHKGDVNEFAKKYKFLHTNDKGIFLSIPSDNKFYLPNGVNTQEFKDVPHKHPISFNIGCLGSYSRNIHKGKERVEKIVNILKNDGYNVNNKSLFINPKENVLSRSEIYNFYKSIDIFIVSSMSETTPNPLLEAMSMGIPTLSNDTGIAKYLINNGHNGFLINHYDDIDSYVLNIKRLIDNKDLYESISINSINSIKKFDWSVMSNGYKDMIEKVLIKLK